MASSESPSIPAGGAASAAAPLAVTLADAVRGRACTVLAIDGSDALAARLRDLGLWPGTVVELITTAPFGDPMLFWLRGFRLALRRDEARRVRVSL